MSQEHSPATWDANDWQDARSKLAVIARYMESLENFDDATFLRRLSESLPVSEIAPSGLMKELEDLRYAADCPVSSTPEDNMALWAKLEEAYRAGRLVEAIPSAIRQNAAPQEAQAARPAMEGSGDSKSTIRSAQPSSVEPAVAAPVYTGAIQGGETITSSAWISCMDRKPENHATVLTTDGEVTSTGFWTGAVWIVDVATEMDPLITPTHWLPIPEVPRG